jgi:hypothetical protein
MRHPVPIVAVMGTKNRQRRAAKARKRARQHERRRTEPRSGPTARPPTTVRQLLWLAATDRGVDSLAAVDMLTTADAALVGREAESLLLLAIGGLWDNGWQPAEVVRLARRADGRAGRLMATAVAADHVRRDPSTLHTRWAAQVESLDLPDVASAIGWVAAFGRVELLHQVALVQTIVAALGAAYGAGRLRTIIPPPGASGARSMADRDPAINDPILLKVRALLAQAESTTFEAEAETFTAKAQELMARHAIDAALLWSATERDERPISIRIPIDDPYVDIKSFLLQCVARRSRCRSVWDDHHALATVVGFASDVASTEMLFTSLLVQAQTALQVEGSKAGPGGRSRSRSFRSSFLMAFTQRIDQRLAEINQAVEQTVEAETSGSLLPVLASRDNAVEDEVAAMFGQLVMSSVRGGSDAAGWACGRLAADLAELNTPLRTPPPRTPAAIATETES